MVKKTLMYHALCNCPFKCSFALNNMHIIQSFYLCAKLSRIANNKLFNKYLHDKSIHTTIKKSLPKFYYKL